MEKTGLILLILISFTSCNVSDDGTGGKQDEYSEYIVHPNSKLEIETTQYGISIDIIPGDKLVFEYHFTKESNPNISDSGYDEYLYFEQVAGTEDFRLTSEDLRLNNTYLRRACFCMFTDFRPVTTGEISGEKTGNMEWNVSFDVEAVIEENGEPIETIAIQSSGKFRPE